MRLVLLVPVALASAACLRPCPAEDLAPLARAGVACDDARVERRYADGALARLAALDGEREVSVGADGSVGGAERVQMLTPEAMFRLFETRVFWEEYVEERDARGTRMIARGTEDGHDVTFTFDADGALVREERRVPRSDVPAPVLARLRTIEPGYFACAFTRVEERGRTLYRAQKYVGTDELIVEIASDGRVVRAARERTAPCRCGG